MYKKMALIIPIFTLIFLGIGCDLLNPTGKDKVVTPVLSPAGGTYTAAQTVTISCPTSGATVYYTLDGTSPSGSSSVYSGSITITTTTTVQAFAVKDGYTDSDIAAATYTISGATPTQPPGATDPPVNATPTAPPTATPTPIPDTGTKYYEIEIHTGDISGAGTDADVFIIVYGSQNTTDAMQLDTSIDNFEQNDIDYFNFSHSNLGNLLQIRIWHDDSGSGSGWYLDYVELTNITDSQTWRFTADRWLATDEDDGAIDIIVPVD